MSYELEKEVCDQVVWFITLICQFMHDFCILSKPVVVKVIS